MISGQSEGSVLNATSELTGRWLRVELGHRFSRLRVFSFSISFTSRALSNGTKHYGVRFKRNAVTKVGR